jgi:hypothetical protein
MTAQQKLDAIEKILIGSFNGNDQFPFSIIRAQFTKTIIEEIQTAIGDEEFASMTEPFFV